VNVWEIQSVRKEKLHIHSYIETQTYASSNVVSVSDLVSLFCIWFLQNYTAVLMIAYGGD